jgi:hypothetical protein
VYIEAAVNPHASLYCVADFIKVKNKNRQRYIKNTRTCVKEKFETSNPLNEIFAIPGERVRRETVRKEAHYEFVAGISCVFIGCLRITPAHLTRAFLAIKSS